MIDSIALLATPTELADAPDPIETIDGEDEAAHWVRIIAVADQVAADSEMSWRFEMIACGEATSTGWAPEHHHGGPFDEDDEIALASLRHLGVLADGHAVTLSADGHAVAGVLAERDRL